MATRNHTKFFMDTRERCKAMKKTNRSAITEMTDMRGGFANKGLLASNSDIEEPMPEMDLSLPPQWVDIVEEVNVDVARIKDKMSELSKLHSKHILVSSFDDVDSNQHEIELVTQDISRLFHNAEKKIKAIGRRAAQGTEITHQEATLRKNIMSNLAGQVQELSLTFRQNQKRYLKVLKDREEQGDAFVMKTKDIETVTLDDLDDETLYDPGFTGQQLSQLENSEALVSEREREIKQIAASIQDLSVIFKELAVLVIDQGTILDRIDYNVEQVAQKMEGAVKELDKAAGYQKNGRFYLCVLLLVLMIFGLGTSFIIKMILKNGQPFSVLG